MNPYIFLKFERQTNKKRENESEMEKRRNICALSMTHNPQHQRKKCYVLPYNIFSRLKTQKTLTNGFFDVWQMSFVYTPYLSYFYIQIPIFMLFSRIYKHLVCKSKIRLENKDELSLSWKLTVTFNALLNFASMLRGCNNSYWHLHF